MENSRETENQNSEFVFDPEAYLARKATTTTTESSNDTDLELETRQMIVTPIRCPEKQHYIKGRCRPVVG